MLLTQTVLVTHSSSKLSCYQIPVCVCVCVCVHLYMHLIVKAVEFLRAMPYHMVHKPNNEALLTAHQISFVVLYQQKTSYLPGTGLAWSRESSWLVLSKIHV